LHGEDRTHGVSAANFDANARPFEDAAYGRGRPSGLTGAVAKLAAKAQIGEGEEAEFAVGNPLPALGISISYASIVAFTPLGMLIAGEGGRGGDQGENGERKGNPEAHGGGTLTQFPGGRGIDGRTFETKQVTRRRLAHRPALGGASIHPFGRSGGRAPEVAVKVFELPKF
jgi:hypothetical protein